MQVTSHHVTVDWKLLSRHGRISLSRTFQGTHPMPTTGVLNSVYGLRPHMPDYMARFGYRCEFVSFLLMMGVTTLCLEETKTNLFYNIGLGSVMHVTALQTCTLMTSVGGVVYIVSGSAYNCFFDSSTFKISRLMRFQNPFPPFMEVSAVPTSPLRSQVYSPSKGGYRGTGHQLRG